MGISCPTEGRTAGKAGGSQHKKREVGQRSEGRDATAVGDMQRDREGSKRGDGGGGGGEGFLN